MKFTTKPSINNDFWFNTTIDLYKYLKYQKFLTKSQLRKAKSYIDHGYENKNYTTIVPNTHLKHKKKAIYITTVLPDRRIVTVFWDQNKKIIDLGIAKVTMYPDMQDYDLLCIIRAWD
jgi:hypothetical protein